MRISMGVLLVGLCQFGGCGERDQWWDYGDGRINLKGVRSIKTHMRITLKSTKGLPGLVARGIPANLQVEVWTDDEIIARAMQEARDEGGASSFELGFAEQQLKVFMGLARLAPDSPLGQLAQKRTDWKCTVADGPISEASMRRLREAIAFLGEEVESAELEAVVELDDVSVSLPGFEGYGIPFASASDCIRLAEQWLAEVRKVEALAG